MYRTSSYGKTYENELEKSAYIRLISLFTMVSVAIIAFAAYLSYNWIFSWPLFVVCLIGMLVSPFIFVPSEDIGRTAFGVSLMSISAGFMIGPVLATYAIATVIQALVITVGIVGVMSVLGLIFPKFFEGFGPYLMAALIVLIMAQFAQIIFIWLGFPAAANLPILYWIGIGLFSLYVAYDWSKAIKGDFTANNAIKVAGSLTLDILNIFLRVLGLKGKSD